jgi:hypothetical protein
MLFHSHPNLRPDEIMGRTPSGPAGSSGAGCRTSFSPWLAPRDVDEVWGACGHMGTAFPCPGN